MQKKFLVKQADNVQVDKLVNALGISELTAKILANRDITDIDAARIFLNPELQDFFDPFLMKDMDAAVDRIITAIKNGEKVCVYGDYDVDGMSGTALLIRALRKYGLKAVPYIPRRVEGYGLNIPALEKIYKHGETLLISVDCGISNAKEIAAVKGKLDVIVTDHHLPALEKITYAVAVVDPHQPECPYPDKTLCGAGVAFKLCQALAKKIRGVDVQNYIADVELAALATVADLVPLKGESRKIVRLGLEKMPSSQCIGLRALIKVSGFENKKITSENISFQISPRLNSIGRLESAMTGLKLLLNENLELAEQIAEHIDDANKQRKRIEREIFLQADEKFKTLREESGGDMWSAVISGDSWNAGVIGLTASKLAEKYHLPSVVITHEGILSRGSCRSIPAFHMKNALDTMADLFENYGGHSQAAGFSISSKLVPEFKRRFDNYAREHLTDADFIPVVKVDALFHPSRVDMKTAEEFEKLEPCGTENPAPILACTNVYCEEARIIGSDRTHLSFDIPADLNFDNARDVRAVAFGFANMAALVESEPVNLTYHPAIDEWQGERRVKCFVSSIEPIDDVKNFPTRDQLVKVYKFLYKLRGKTKNFDTRIFAEKFNAASQEKFSMYTILNALEIFKEIGLLRINEDEKTFELPQLPKRNLESSRTFRLMRNS